LQPHYFKVFVDGSFQSGRDSTWGSVFTFGTDGSEWREGSDGAPLVDVVLAANLTANSTHDISVFKATEAQWNEILPMPNYMSLHEIELSGPGAPSMTALPTNGHHNNQRKCFNPSCAIP
jgi:hypothetical protein